MGRGKTGQGGPLHLLGDQNAGLGGEVWGKYLLMLTQESIKRIFQYPIDASYEKELCPADSKILMRRAYVTQLDGCIEGGI